MSLPLIKILLARQGIYNKNGSVHAYELLYRDGDAQTAHVDNLNSFSGDSATSSVIAQLFSNMDMNSIIGNKRAFINFTRNHLLDEVPLLLPKSRIVVEVLETVTVDQRLIVNLEALSQLGYEIALDDFIFHEETRPLIDIANIIKIDILNQTNEQIVERLKPLKGYHGKLLAEKIENKSQFNFCVDLGFDYFQGFFLNKPDPLKGQVITENRVHLLKLLAELNDHDVPLGRVEEIILQIPKLSYRILRLSNSASLYTGKKIDSLMDAISQLGLVQIRNWISLLLLASLDDVAPDLLERTLIRAKMCESLVRKLGSGNPLQAYTVGILSTLDGILNEPMGSLLAKIHLSDTLNDALLYQKGDLGQVLKFATDYEAANFNELDNISLENKDLAQSYLEGIAHASEIMDIINH
ncbi:EAL and HDOD domain-containing protein [Legionella fallonii]|uniref:Putative Diguanylate phosphodiesterase (EAL domain) n=1 Tax=Legionella fallonii LLAP-10 TaxID=1212491 RepID=A0A098FZI9_9GAMM|nr:HDOD domain-containing protein [Legionella fallonii]CEG55647.1 putative Diguanylate phosphodiesterase (EAL domain) [Legionella fallonii LLAP-10]